MELLKALEESLILWNYLHKKNYTNSIAGKKTAYDVLQLTDNRYECPLCVHYREGYREPYGTEGCCWECNRLIGWVDTHESYDWGDHSIYCIKEQSLYRKFGDSTSFLEKSDLSGRILDILMTTYLNVVEEYNEHSS